MDVSPHAASQAPTKLGVKPGQTLEVEDAIKALVTKSANDAAVVVAENLAGTHEEFAEQMTRKARQLGMSRTVFRNANGLPDPEQVTTARDLITLGRAIQDRFPKYYTYFSTRVFHYAGASYRNHNRLLGRIEGVDGIKTGFIGASGFNVLTNVKTDDRHIVAVVLGGRSAASRDNRMAALVGDTLPRAYAGNRTAPVVAESNTAARPTVVADASSTASLPLNLAPAPVAAAATPAPRKPLDLTTLRPVVASATGASSTTTPSSGPTVRWQKGPEGVPQNTQAYAALSDDVASPQANTPQKAKADAKLEDRVPAAPVVAAKAAAAKEEAVESKKVEREAVTGWVIQLGATEDEDKAKAMLDAARSRSGKLLAKASPFTEKVTKGSDVLYRARFSGFDESKEAERACKTLKKSGFACFASRG